MSKFEKYLTIIQETPMVVTDNNNNTDRIVIIKYGELKPMEVNLNNPSSQASKVFDKYFADKAKEVFSAFKNYCNLRNIDVTGNFEITKGGKSIIDKSVTPYYQIYPQSEEMQITNKIPKK